MPGQRESAFLSTRRDRHPALGAPAARRREAGKNGTFARAGARQGQESSTLLFLVVPHIQSGVLVFSGHPAQEQEPTPTRPLTHTHSLN
eukprot:2142515-Pyramimonas_sp.AAC.1